MASKHIPPSITEVSFSCPHCGALAHQDWFEVYGRDKPANETPFQPDPSVIQRVESEKSLAAEERAKLIRYFERLLAREVFMDEPREKAGRLEIANMALSKCYSCRRISVWINEAVVHPPIRNGDEPNADLPDAVRRDFEEARSIVQLSPRGAAALLRLCIQKICIHLKKPGKNLDDDIAGLVKAGLDLRVQKALDIVRVIGNESVHPGQMDLRDGQDTATELFRLVNLIADVMISQPKAIEAMYSSLPPSKLKGIEERDRSRDS